MRKLFLYTVLLLSSITAFTQNNDSLYRIFNTTAIPDSERISAIYDYANNIQYNYPDSAYKLMEECFLFSKNKKLNYGMGYSSLMKGNYFYLKGEYAKALEEFNKSLNYLAGTKKLHAIASVYSSIGTTYYYLANYPKSLDYHFMSFKIRDSLEDGDKGGSLVNIGAVYSQMENFKKANEYQLRALDYYEAMKMDDGKAMALSNISANYLSAKDYKKAMSYQLQSLELERKNKNKPGIAISLDIIGVILMEEGNYPLAEFNMNKALEIKNELGDAAGKGVSFSNLALIYMKQGQYEKAREFSLKAKTISKEVGDLYTYNSTQINMVTIYKGLKDYKNAVEELENYVKLKDSLFEDERKREVALKDMQYDFDKKESDLKIEQQVKNAIDAEEKRQQRIIIYGVSVVLLLTLILAAVIFKSLQANKRKNKIITEQKQEVEKQKEIVEHQKELVLEKQKEILDSITYAKRIQRAHLPTDKYIIKSLEKLKKS